jgi:hypothetical protein
MRKEEKYSIKMRFSSDKKKVPHSSHKASEKSYGKREHGKGAKLIEWLKRAENFPSLPTEEEKIPFQIQTNIQHSLAGAEGCRKMLNENDEKVLLSLCLFVDGESHSVQ